MRRHQIIPGVVSAIILVAFCAVLALVLMRAIPESNKDATNLLLGSLATMAMGVVSYWLGSSVGSADKTQMMADKDRAP